jgi:hypothetical protein
MAIAGVDPTQDERLSSWREAEARNGIEQPIAGTPIDVGAGSMKTLVAVLFDHRSNTPLDITAARRLREQPSAAEHTTARRQQPRASIEGPSPGHTRESCH